MTAKIIKLNELNGLSERVHNEGEKLVLAGGCFDILHKGHLAFLKAAKQTGDILIVMLESDEQITERKGPDRPINSQNHRAQVLASLPTVDYILLLPANMTDADYDQVVLQLKPAIIATTKGDPGIRHKKRQAEKINAVVTEVIERQTDYATTDLIKKL